MHRPEIIRIAAEASRDPRTVEKVLKGGGTPFARAAVEAAARRLGITLPPSYRPKSEAERFEPK